MGETNTPDESMPPWKEELEPIKDRLNEERREIEGNLNEIQKVENLSKDFDSLGMVGVDAEVYDYNGPGEHTQVHFVGYLYSLKGEKKGKLMERAISLNPADSKIEWDDESDTYRVSVRLYL